MLRVKTKFADWIKRRIIDSLFVEGNDFMVLKKENPENTGVSRESTEYYVTIEMAKHLAMMENTKRGYEVRQYFILLSYKFLTKLSGYITEKLSGLLDYEPIAYRNKSSYI